MDKHLDEGQIGDRFPTNNQILRLVGEGHPIHFSIPGTPPVTLVVASGGSSIGLELPPGELPKDLRPYRAIRIAADPDHVRISATQAALFPDFIRLLAAITERVQVGGTPSGQAISEALDSWQKVLQRDRGISQEQEVGLLGEVWTIWRLIAGGMPSAEAVKAWRGPDSEEHDFGLAKQDLEVKSTSSETRVHVISGLSQLVQTGDRPLWLLSLQFTRSGAAGATLREFIQLVRNLLPGSEAAARNSYDEKVHAVIGDREDLLDTRWRLRSTPTVTQVDDFFPRLTPDLLGEVPVELRPHIHEVWYRIDVEGLGVPDGATEAASLLGEAPLESPWI